jgi:hypothetical protein
MLGLIIPAPVAWSQFSTKVERIDKEKRTFDASTKRIAVGGLEKAVLGLGISGEHSLSGALPVVIGGAQALNQPGHTSLELFHRQLRANNSSTHVIHGVGT